MAGRGAKVYNADCYPEYYKEPSEQFRKKMLIFSQIRKELKVERVSSMVNLMTNHWILDGTYHIGNNYSMAGKTTGKILNFNEKLRKKRPFAQHYDAMTAEAALYHHCIFVTDDDDLRDMVNEDFPSSAVSTQELVTRIQEVAKEVNHNAQQT